MEKINLSLLNIRMVDSQLAEKPVETLAYRKKRFSRMNFYLKARGSIYGDRSNKPLKK